MEQREGKKRMVKLYKSPNNVDYLDIEGYGHEGSLSGVKKSQAIELIYDIIKTAQFDSLDLIKISLMVDNELGNR